MADQRRRRHGETLRYEVKGVWFTTAKRYVADRHAPEMLEEVAAAMGEQHREAILHPLASEWYPEETLQQGMAAMSRVLADGDPERFAGVLEVCTDLGINHFFRALIRIGSPAMVLRKVPTMWNLIRRGDATVNVEANEERAAVRYEKFPYFQDSNYRILTLASLRTLVRICCGREPRVEITAYERDALAVLITWR
jgi:hypothetical protein